MMSTELLDGLEPIRDGAVAYVLPMTFLELAVIKYPKTNEYDIAGFKDEGDAKCPEIGDICSVVRRLADPHHGYVIRFRGSPLSDDTLDIAVDPKTGFLTKVHGKAIDRTGDIIVAATRTALGDVPKPKAFADRGAPELVERIGLDPNNSRQLAYVNRRLGENYDLTLRCTGACSEPAPPVTEAAEEVYYRLPRTIFLQIISTKKGGIVSIHALSSYNGSPLIAQRVERAPFVTRETTIDYVDGVAKYTEHKKPSEALGMVTTVGEVAGAVVWSPINAITAQTSSLEAESKYLQAREKLLNDRAKLLETEAQFQSKTAGAQTSFSDPRIGEGNTATTEDAIDAGAQQ